MCKTINPKSIAYDQLAGWRKGTREYKEMRVTIGVCSCRDLVIWAWLPGYEKQKVECEIKPDWSVATNDDRYRKYG